MIPALWPKQIIVASSLVRPKKGSIIIFQHDGKEKIKRVVAVKHGKFYVLGDNGPMSTDSRHFGPVDPSAFIATLFRSR